MILNTYWSFTNVLKTRTRKRVFMIKEKEF